MFGDARTSELALYSCGLKFSRIRGARLEFYPAVKSLRRDQICCAVILSLRRRVKFDRIADRCGAEVGILSRRLGQILSHRAHCSLDQITPPQVV